MSDFKRYSTLASNARISALKLAQAGRHTHAAKARAQAIRYDKLAKLARLGSVIGK